MEQAPELSTVTDGPEKAILLYLHSLCPVALVNAQRAKLSSTPSAVGTYFSSSLLCCLCP